MRLIAVCILALTTFGMPSPAAAKDEAFSLIGEWVSSNSNGSTVRYLFKPDHKVTWIVEEPGQEVQWNDAQYTIEGQNPFNLKIHDFLSHKLKGVKFQGIVEVLSLSQFRLDYTPSNLWARPAEFGTNTLVFVAKSPPAPRGTRTALIDGTIYTNTILEYVDDKTVMFSHSRGVASLNITKLTASERQALHIPEPAVTPKPVEPAKKQVNLSSLPFKGLTIIKIFFYSIFGGIAPFIIRIAAGIVHVEEITAWRCFKAGMGGIVGLGGALTLGAQFESIVLTTGFMALLWMAMIQTALKTSIPKTFAIWLMTHGTLFLAGMTVSHFFDVRGGLMQIVAQK